MTDTSKRGMSRYLSDPTPSPERQLQKFVADAAEAAEAGHTGPSGSTAEQEQNVTQRSTPVADPSKRGMGRYLPRSG